VLTICFPFSDKLGIVQMVDQDGFWMKMMLKFLLFSRIISMRSLVVATTSHNNQ